MTLKARNQDHQTITHDMSFAAGKQATAVRTLASTAP